MLQRRSPNGVTVTSRVSRRSLEAFNRIQVTVESSWEVVEFYLHALSAAYDLGFLEHDPWRPLGNVSGWP